MQSKTWNINLGSKQYEIFVVFAGDADCFDSFVVKLDGVEIFHNV